MTTTENKIYRIYEETNKLWFKEWFSGIPTWTTEKKDAKEYGQYQYQQAIDEKRALNRHDKRWKTKGNKITIIQ